VDIGAAQSAILPILAFEGATKKNKPNLTPGTLVYARVTLANKDMEAELQCFNPSTGKSDGYGELKGGFVIKCSLGLCRRYSVLVLLFYSDQVKHECHSDSYRTISPFQLGYSTLKHRFLAS
jgi:hypothetical protein